ncbi:EAL domain-containing protein [Bacillus sp. P1(2020)]|uniref:EAL domain-containing protein n=2 Tax=Pallidibacillus pasinlerensis TaxID=2703818 RepID=A0ABX0A599_9BACI|nr:EAL domain-containing protein [Pallidibacillus pasinlerensis]
MLLDSNKLKGKWLRFEITESSIMKLDEIISVNLNELKKMGIIFYIDDFGTGYSLSDIYKNLSSME